MSYRGSLRTCPRCTLRRALAAACRQEASLPTALQVCGIAGLHYGACRGARCSSSRSCPHARSKTAIECVSTSCRASGLLDRMTARAVALAGMRQPLKGRSIAVILAAYPKLGVFPEEAALSALAKAAAQNLHTFAPGGLLLELACAQTFKLSGSLERWLCIQPPSINSGQGRRADPAHVAPDAVQPPWTSQPAMAASAADSWRPSTAFLSAERWLARPQATSPTRCERLVRCAFARRGRWWRIWRTQPPPPPPSCRPTISAAWHGATRGCARTRGSCCSR